MEKNGETVYSHSRAKTVKRDAVNNQTKGGSGLEGEG